MHPQKVTLRTAVEERLALLTQAARAAESRSICRRILEDLPQPLDTLCLYIPLKTEVDIARLFEECVSRRIPIYLPRFTANRLEFRRMEDSSSLIKGELGIPEPPVSADLLPEDGSMLFLVPGRAFDRTGGRLGRGNGGYDRFIRSYRSVNPQALFWGVAYECQILPEIPQEGHDEWMDAVMTARGRQSI